MTAKTPQRPFRSAASPTLPATGTVAIPSTLWAAGSEALDPDDRWPEPILSRAVREFSVPGGRVLLIGWPTPTTRGALHLAEPDTAAALATVAALGRHGVSEPDPGTDEPVDLVVVSLLADHLDPVAAADRVAGLAVARMAMGGLLVVLGRCRHSDEGVLIDPAGAVVAAAQAADLLYLQHIIAVPVTGHTITATAAADALAPSARRHVVAHTDVFVFLQPSAQD
ncbi:hypothetical protein [Nocardia anaemiae]|uniref:hypothetical protein n=1 Tax=Nocardia anaemiae TaxID=263910 RepID=UPI0007A453E6|nr:hypothetical protein [Nocardia anaemiae]